MDRNLYYVPEEEMDEVLRSQSTRKRLGLIQVVISVSCILSFACTDVDYHNLPWTALIVGIILAVSGIVTLDKYDSINKEYDLPV